MCGNSLCTNFFCELAQNEKPSKTKRPVGTPVDGTPNKTNVLKDSKIPQPSDARPVSNAMEKMNINDNKENQNGATSQTEVAGVAAGGGAAGKAAAGASPSLSPSSSNKA